MLMERSYRQDLSTSPAYPGYRKLHSSHIPPESRQIMRIVCPSCAARYEIADAMLAKPRTVRCSRCAREWLQDPIPTEIPEPAAPEPEIAEPPAETLQPPAPAPVIPEPPAPAEPSRPVQSAAKKTDSKVVLAWIASLLLLAALAFAAYTDRAEIQTAWPPSARIFKLLPN